MRVYPLHAAWLLAAVPLLFAGGASATTIELSTASSDETPADVLDATFDFAITGASELTLTVTNDTTAPDEFNINEIFFNAASNVTGLSLDGATHSAEGDVTSEWAPVDTGVMVNGFGVFDFGLTDGMGETHPSVIGPGEDVVFVFTISGAGPFDMSDFAVPNLAGFTVAAKFVNGPEDDSAFGAVPEPGTAALLGAGLVALSLRRHAPRRRVRAHDSGTRS